MDEVPRVSPLQQICRDNRKAYLFITHDLDEAIRIGHRIAIMKDGVIVQIGTPEEIITAPADDYVAEFVKDISRLKLVFAHTVMQSLEAYQLEMGEDLSHLELGQCPRADQNADLDHLIDLAVEYDRPILVTDQGTVVGVVTKRLLLRGIQGESHSAIEETSHSAIEENSHSATAGGIQ